MPPDIEVEVPSGYVTILVVGKYNSDGVYANYMRFNKLSLDQGDNDVIIDTKPMSSWASELDAGSVADSGIITWKNLGIPVKYHIEDLDYLTVYENDGSSARSLTGGCRGYPFTSYLKFDQFGITLSSVDTVLVYDSNQF